MVGHGGSSAGSYLADPTSPIPSHSASIAVTTTVRVNRKTNYNTSAQENALHTWHEQEKTSQGIKS